MTLTPKDKHLHRLAFAQERIAHWMSERDAAALNARDSDATWAEIGDAMGITRQGAFQSYGRSS